MKIAIIGAGLSGLACAVRLKKYGIKPTIYEKGSYVGDRICSACIGLRVFSSTHNDSFSYLKKEYGLDLKPISPIKKLVMNSPNNKVCIHGHLGNILERGMDPFSIESQLAAIANVPINFNSAIEIDDMKNEYDHIIVATGNNLIAKKMGVWTNTFTAYARYATVVGKFDTSEVVTWFDTQFAKNAFCYRIPVNSKEASIVLIVNGITHDELDYYWKEFLNKINIPYPIIQITDTEHNCGIVSPIKKDNVYFVGNTAGLTDSFIGIGGVNAIESGILAADAIVKNADYTQLVDPIVQNVKKINVYREIVNTFENNDYDRLISFVNLPLVKQFVYRNPFFKVSATVPLAQALHRLLAAKSLQK